jgi:fermentation-respiration switch protein FrsA (DUF1100 family)
LFRRFFRLAALIYLGVLIVMYALQTRLVFPGLETQGQPYAQVRPIPGTELVRLRTERGESIVALHGPALRPDGSPHPDPEGCPTLLYFYGNAMCLNDAALGFDQFRRLGMNVLIPEYVGFGMSEGSASETGCEATADAAYTYLVSTRALNPARIIAGGWSLGGAVAIDLASRKEVGGLVIFSTFTRAVDMARRVAPFLPVSLLMHHRFENLEKIARVRCPILIGHGRRDSIAPFWMGESLATAARSPVSTLWLDTADHNDFYEVGGRRIDQAITSFKKSLPLEGPP